MNSIQLLCVAVFLLGFGQVLALRQARRLRRRVFKLEMCVLELAKRREPDLMEKLRP